MGLQYSLWYWGQEYCVGLLLTTNFTFNRQFTVLATTLRTEVTNSAQSFVIFGVEMAESKRVPNKTSHGTIARYLVIKYHSNQSNVEGKGEFTWNKKAVWNYYTFALKQNWGHNSYSVNKSHHMHIEGCSCLSFSVFSTCWGNPILMVEGSVLAC